MWTPNSHFVVAGVFVVLAPLDLATAMECNVFRNWFDWLTSGRWGMGNVEVGGLWDPLSPPFLFPGHPTFLHRRHIFVQDGDWELAQWNEQEDMWSQICSLMGHCCVCAQTLVQKWRKASINAKKLQRWFSTQLKGMSLRIKSVGKHLPLNNSNFLSFFLSFFLSQGDVFSPFISIYIIFVGHTDKTGWQMRTQKIGDQYIYIYIYIYIYSWTYVYADNIYISSLLLVCLSVYIY